jgi:hypothetical protein
MYLRTQRNCHKTAVIIAVRLIRERIRKVVLAVRKMVLVVCRVVIPLCRIVIAVSTMILTVDRAVLAVCRIALTVCTAVLTRKFGYNESLPRDCEMPVRLVVQSSSKDHLAKFQGLEPKARRSVMLLVLPTCRSCVSRPRSHAYRFPALGSGASPLAQLRMFATASVRQFSCSMGYFQLRSR